MLTVLQQWIRHLESAALSPDGFNRGGIKFFTRQSFKYTLPATPIDLADVHYTQHKATQLLKNYWVQESIDAAVTQWEKKGEKPLANVAITTHGHHTKSHFHEGANVHASAAGPCLSSIMLLRRLDGGIDVEVFLRSSEAIRKQPADLWLIPKFLEPFGITDCNFYFRPLVFQIMANQWGLAVFHQDDPVDFLERLAEADPKLYKSIIKALHYDLFVPSDQKNFIPTKRPGEWLHSRLPAPTLTELSYYVKRSHRRV